MKKAFFAILIGLALCTGISFAGPESEYYPVTVSVEKIYRHRLGYVVTYQRGMHQLARTYIPYEWFTDPDGKAELIGLDTGRVWPYMTVYYKAGVFSHVRLYARKAPSHITWSVVPMDVNIDQYFENVEEIRLEF